MENNVCTKRFPKPFNEETIADAGGYPNYKRSSNGHVIIDAKKNRVSNQWVVPYNPHLLLKYNAHINVEICSNFKSYKYIFKYAYKGYDCTTLERNLDEVKTFLDCR